MSRSWELVAAMARVGTIGFGGGSALIPVVEKEVVERRRLLDDATFTAHTVIANVTPGALPVKLGALAGATVGGGRASAAAALAVAIPGSAATVGLLAGFSVVGAGAIRYVEFAAVGITAFIIVLLVSYIAKVLRGQRVGVAVAIMAVVFLATGANQLVRMVAMLAGSGPGVRLPRLPSVPALTVILVAIVLIGLSALWWRSADDAVAPEVIASPGRGTTSGALWFLGAMLAAGLAGWWLAGVRGVGFLGLVAASTVSSFGGGEAYVGVADGFFVGPGIVDPATFYGQIVPVANALPGPILVKIAGGMGFVVGEADGVAVGLGLATLAIVVAVSSCAAIALVILGAWSRFAHSLFLRRLGRFILPVICGLLATTMCSMVVANGEIGVRAGLPATWLAWGTLGLAALLWWLHVRFRAHDFVLLGIGGGASLLVLSLAS